MFICSAQESTAKQWKGRRSFQGPVWIIGSVMWSDTMERQRRFMIATENSDSQSERTKNYRGCFSTWYQQVAIFNIQKEKKKKYIYK